MLLPFSFPISSSIHYDVNQKLYSHSGQMEGGHRYIANLLYTLALVCSRIALSEKCYLRPSNGSSNHHNRFIPHDRCLFYIKTRPKVPGEGKCWKRNIEDHSDWKCPPNREFQLSNLHLVLLFTSDWFPNEDLKLLLQPRCLMKVNYFSH